ncbi:MAG: DegT/DnrJ/EryC1/StrS family aminotransferase [Candidatus Omnitrophica bacterium]|nr:DegT/DnrJ/EryC1/StrS family aminotransferase [Candidatus Omnitrophota bacterium]
MKIPLVDLKAQYSSIKSEIDNAIAKVIAKTSFILGEEVSSFENEFSNFCDTRYAVGVSSGTAALQLALVSLGIGEGDEVITTPFTFIATSESILEVGAHPVFVDIEEDTYNIDVKLVEKAITRKTKAIIPVHLYGHPVDMDPLMEIARKHNIAVIEDACQAHGALYKGRKVGSIGDAGCFSFYPGKNLGCYGDGGMLVTNNEQIFEKTKLLRDHGRSDKYTHIAHGYNFRLDGIQAAILKVKLKYLEKWNDKRRKNAGIYNEGLSPLGSVTQPVEKEYAKHVYHLYVIRIKERDKLKLLLSENSIDTGIHYPIPLHKQPVYKKIGLSDKKLPVSEKCAKDILSLPIYAELEEDDIRKICNLIAEF